MASRRVADYGATAALLNVDFGCGGGATLRPSSKTRNVELARLAMMSVAAVFEQTATGSAVLPRRRASWLS